MNNEWANEGMNKWANKWMNERSNERTNKQTNKEINRYFCNWSGSYCARQLCTYCAYTKLVLFLPAIVRLLVCVSCVSLPAKTEKKTNDQQLT